MFEHLSHISDKSLIVYQVLHPHIQNMTSPRMGDSQNHEHSKMEIPKTQTQVGDSLHPQTSGISHFIHIFGICFLIFENKSSQQKLNAVGQSLLSWYFRSSSDTPLQCHYIRHAMMIFTQANIFTCPDKADIGGKTLSIPKHVSPYFCYLSLIYKLHVNVKLPSNFKYTRI